VTEIVAGIFLMIAVGWLFRRYALVGEEAEKAFNRYLFYLALPALIIVKIADTSFSGLGFDFIILNFLPIFAVMLLAYGAWRAGLADRQFARLLIITAGLGNTVYLGFPVVSMSLGPENLGYAAVAASLQNIFIFTFGFFFIGTVGAGASPPVSFRRLVLKNAVLWSSIAGLFISFAGIKIPAVVYRTMMDIGHTTIPLSLFTIGLSLYGKKLGANLGKAVWISGLKMIVMPAAYLGLALLFGFKGVISRVVFLQMAMPIAVLNYVIAREFEFDADLVSQAIVVSTLMLMPCLFLCDLVMAAFL
jgi:hypothetical protein